MSAEKSRTAPVNLLMSGPAGGVAGAVWVASNSGHANVLTLDMGGTSTDVALIEDFRPRLRRETIVGQDNEAIYGSLLGLGSEQLAELAARNVI